ncbi:spore germination protein [Paenibacillus sp. DMB5]|uniref:spore germination protein n=1 Tax=Paenibacillus sp. DMB5 TaxID=1780103 RepID=UPI00076DE86C|nr:spore germination protein [Paenibacillus sp. DMB5]KUP25813.1 spore gernimation protein KA [Paenibacillus sp. DMB5]
MFFKWLKQTFKPARETQNNQSGKQGKEQGDKTDTNSHDFFSSSLDKNISTLKSVFGQSPDFVLNELMGMNGQVLPGAVCFIDGLIDTTLLPELMETVIKELSSDDSINITSLKSKLPTGNTQILLTKNDAFKTILSGGALVLLQNNNCMIGASIAGGVRRSVEEPTSQTVIRGPKEGFTEELSVNLALLRRKLRTPALKFEQHIIGTYTQTRVVVAYLEGIARPEVVDEVNARLRAIDTDSILESGYIEEMIQDAAITPFPTMLNTERPDTVAGSMLDGMVGILVDGTPFTLIAPVTFFNFFQSSEDYYQRYDISTFLRVIRLMSFFVALLLPSLYIAVTTFQQEMIPTTLLITLAGQREGTPLPALYEALAMELIFEVIREAGVRMPKVIGPAISIVGALVLGQAAVQAGLVSGAMVIVVSFTAIANFVIPAINMASAVRLMRFALMILAGTFGLFGILAGLIPLLAHLVSLRSFGINYFMPYAPYFKSNMKDLILRVPWWAMKTRPNRKAGPNKYRQAPNQYPTSSDETKKLFSEQAQQHRRK